MKKARRDHLVEEAAFDLTPMIDVVMLLIVFFMLTAQFAASMRSPLDLPRQPGDNSPDSEHTLILEINREGAYVVDSQQVSLETVIQTVTAAQRNASSLDLVVRADRAASAADLNRLAMELAKAGVRTWSLATSGEAAGER